MGFVHASLLAALAAVILPVLAHLVFRRRSRPVDLGTLRFLKIAIRRDTRRRLVKRWLLLALRVGCVVFLVLLFSRPFRGEFSGGGDSGLTILLIDRSASMARSNNGQRLIDQAIRKIPEIVNQIPARSRVEAAWFDTKVTPMDSPGDGRGSPATLTAPTNLTGGTDFAAALNWASGRCAAARGSGPLRVHVFTDLQRSGFGSLEDFAFPRDVMVHVWDFYSADDSNSAVTHVRLPRLMVPAEQPVTLQATILNTRTESLERAPVRLRLANKGKVHEISGVATATAGATTTVSLETPPLGPGLWQGTVSLLVEDHLPIDNSRNVAVFAAEKPTVLLLDGAARDIAALGEAYFLEAALRLAPPGETVPDGPFRVNVLPYGADVRLPDLGRVDVLIAANVGSFPPADATRIRGFLERGGSALLFGGSNLGPSSNASYQAAGLSVGENSGTHGARDLPFRIAEFAREHDLLAPFADPQHGDLHRLSFSGCTRLTPATSARVLAHFRDGTPLLLEQTKGPARLLWWTAPVGGEHGEWSRSRLFLPLVHQLVKTAAGQAGSGPVRDVLAGGETLGVRQQGAIWEIRNLEPQESELERCSPEEFAQRLGLTLAPSSDESSEGSENDVGDELRTGELWPWLWLGVALLWMAEGLLANRTVA